MKKYFAVFLSLMLVCSLAACNGKDEEGSSLAGYYPVLSMTLDNEEWSREELEALNMADGTYLQLNEDGTGELGLTGEEPNRISYDEKKGTITTAETKEVLDMSVEGGNIIVSYEEEGMRFVFAPDEEGKSAGSESTGTSKVEGYASSGFFDGVTVAAAVEDAFAGAASFDSGNSSFVSPTTSLKRGTMWYGTMAVTDFVGTNTEDYTKDVVAKLDATSQGWDYIEIYTDSSLSEEYIQLSMYITLYDDGFTADIGDEDAWIFSRYLTEEDAKYFSPSLNNGALVMTYPYVDEEEGYSCTVTFFLREDGTPWDEEHDLLPPSYGRYKEAIGG